MLTLTPPVPVQSVQEAIYFSIDFDSGCTVLPLYHYVQVANYLNESTLTLTLAIPFLSIKFTQNLTLMLTLTLAIPFLFIVFRQSLSLILTLTLSQSVLQLDTDLDPVSVKASA